MSGFDLGFGLVYADAPAGPGRMKIESNNRILALLEFLRKERFRGRWKRKRPSADLTYVLHSST